MNPLMIQDINSLNNEVESHFFLVGIHSTHFSDFLNTSFNTEEKLTVTDVSWIFFA